MEEKEVEETTEKKLPFGLTTALLSAIVFLSGYIKVKDNQVAQWVDKAIACEQDKIKRLDQSLLETKELLYTTQELIKYNDSVNKTKRKK